MDPTSTTDKLTETTEAPQEKWPGNQKVKWAKDYSGGNLRELIAKTETLEELEEVRVFVLERAGKISRKTLHKLEQAGKARHEQLSNQLVVAPPRPRILIPQHVATGNVLVKP